MKTKEVETFLRSLSIQLEKEDSPGQRFHFNLHLHTYWAPGKLI